MSESESNRIGKICYRCEAFVRMSGPEFARDANTWTICPVCRDKLEIEARFAGQVVPQPEEASA